MLRGVFNAYLRDPSLLGRNTVRRMRRDGLERAVCDYLSGMTDSYLVTESEKLCAASKPSRHLRLEIPD